MKVLQLMTEAPHHGVEFEVDKEIEVLISTQDHGIHGHNSDYYGLGFQGKIVKVEGVHIRIELTGQGFFGAYDAPDSPVRGKPVLVMLDTSRCRDIRMTGDRIQLNYH
jgi:hypothetical protein